MIGRRLSAPVRRDHAVDQQPGVPARLRVDNLSLKGENKKLLDNISFEIGRGEILGLAGVDGNGQTELAEVLVGIRLADAGKIAFNGRTINHLRVKQRKRLGMAHVPDDRHNDGLILDMNVVANLMLNIYDRAPFAVKKLVRTKVLREHARKKITQYRIKTPGLKTLVRYLSGGNQQKLILARELHGSPELIIACQPTRGLDIGAEEFVYQTLWQQKLDGAGVLLISADLEQIMALSDRIAVIFAGRITGIVENNDSVNLAQIGLNMAGLKAAGLNGEAA